MIVLHNGSGNGVDAINKFNPILFDDHSVVQLKKSLGIDVNQKVIGFVGRLAIDKGLSELVDAWKIVRGKNRSVCLLILGGEDARDPAPNTLISDLKSDPRVRMVGSIDNAKVPLYYSAMDLLALPTYREGFPNVVLEASAMELPVVACEVTGCVDAVVDGVTGTLVPARDSVNLANSIIKYLDNPEICKKHGTAGRQRALRDFRPEDLWEALYNEYSYQLKKNKVS
jgi:glycosyltransferase involved in cell wall biosynthesis